MEAEITLLAVSLLSLLILKMKSGQLEYALAARIGMSAMLVMTAFGHFLFAKGMSMIIPAFIPYKIELVYLSGVLEIAAATGLCIPMLRKMTAWWLILFFIALLPANIYEAKMHVAIQKATFDGNGFNLFMVPGTAAGIFYCLGLSVIHKTMAGKWPTNRRQLFTRRYV